MRVHVFCSDVLPRDGHPTTGGGLRSAQVVALFESMGHEVTASEPRTFSASMLSRSQSVRSQYLPDRADQLARIDAHRAQVVVFCYPTACRLLQEDKRSTKIQLIFDVHGPTFVEEGLMLDQAVGASFAKFAAALALADGILCANSYQKGLVLSCLAYSGVSSPPWIELLPLHFDQAPITRKLDTDPILVSAGGFYPWQRPWKALEAVGRRLAERGRGTLVIAGHHHNLRGSQDVDRNLQRLSDIPSISIRGLLSREQLLEVYAQAWCCVELMDRSVERIMAFTTRTWEQLSLGIPILYNNYSFLSELIEGAQAGWTVNPSDLDKILNLVDEIIGDANEVMRRGRNARALTETAFDYRVCAERIKSQCDLAQSQQVQSISLVGGPAVSIGRKPRVLVIGLDTSAILDLRVHGPLSALAELGEIEGYCVVDGDGRCAGPNYFEVYDSILILREVSESQSERLLEKGLKFGLDLDDLLVSVPRYSLASNRPAYNLDLLRKAAYLTVTTTVLLRNLEKHTRLDLAQKCLLVPNGLPFGESLPLNETRRADALVWVSSDYLSLAHSRAHILEAIRDFSRARNMPVLLFGRFDDGLKRALPNMRDMGFVPFWQHKQFLASRPGLIGLAPLETVCDQQMQDYIQSKSDLKMVEFGGYGHVGVYTDVVPYSNSELSSGVRVPNTYAGWHAGLEEAYLACSSEAVTRVREIRADRDLRSLARKGRLEGLLQGIIEGGVRADQLIGKSTQTKVVVSPDNRSGPKVRKLSAWLRRTSN